MPKAAPDPDPCGAWRGAGFFGSATYDAMVGTGVLQRSDDGTVSGHVSAGDFVLSVSDDDLALVRRILATARVEGVRPSDRDGERDGVPAPVPVSA